MVKNEIEELKNFDRDFENKTENQIEELKDFDRLFENKTFSS